MNRLAMRLFLLVAIVFPGCNGCLGEVDGRSPIGPATAEGTVIAYMLARSKGHDGDEYWRGQPSWSLNRATTTQPLDPTKWERIEENSDSGWSWFRYRVTSTSAEGTVVQRLWDYCVDDFGVSKIVASWFADDGTPTKCAALVAEIDIRTGRRLSSAEKALVSFLNAKKAGGSGDTFWRESVPPWPRVTGPALVSPTIWKKVAEQGKVGWWWFRYEITSTVLRDGGNIPNDISARTWDYCLVDTVKGPRILGAWYTADQADTEKECAAANGWPKYRYQ